VIEGTGSREQSTTMAFGQLLTQLLRDQQIGKHVVPIVADEARTFGMHTLFRQAGIYSPLGQLYEPEDMGALVYYREATDGQILEEGICEAGALSSWIAAATSYATHGVPMLPLYIFYSCFGFQRVGDLIWAAADQRARGFLIGATAGRTTLSGEGLQHQDGTSQLSASTIATCRAYDPCFGYELATIMQDGIRRMLDAQEDVFYYITAMNENYAHPAMPEGSAAGIVRGMYLVQERTGAAVQLLGSGTILREALAAAEILEREHGVAANVWSVTSWSELRWDGMLASGRASAAVQEARGVPTGAPSWVSQCLDASPGPIIAATDYVSAVPDLIRPFIPRGRDYVALGTDGFGRSDLRANLRAFFSVDRDAIVRAALEQLGR
jgi:pyruvate dehydrogenase E1 component